MGLIPGQAAKMPHASWPKKQNIKQKLCCNKFNKDFKKIKLSVIIIQVGQGHLIRRWLIENSDPEKQELAIW